MDWIKTLQHWIRPIDDIFQDFGKYTIDGRDNKKRRIFIDNKSDVLFVAHLDTVLSPQIKKIRWGKSKPGKARSPLRIYGTGLDDRLGCAIALVLSRDLVADLLLTDGEECGQSSGQFQDLKDYNWIVEFDRAGDDVVTYGLDGGDFIKAIKEYWRLGIGCFSDVCQLETNCCCMNVGIGYELAHSRDSYFVVKTAEKQIKRFRKFYEKYRGTKFERREICKDTRDRDGWLLDDWNNQCDLCGSYGGQFVFDHTLCRECVDILVDMKCDEMYGNLK